MMKGSPSDLKQSCSDSGKEDTIMPAVLPLKPRCADIHLAIMHGNLDELYQNIAAGGNINGKVQGATPLGTATCRGFVDAVTLLTSTGANVNEVSRDHVGREEPPLCSACRLGNLEIVKILLKVPSLRINQCDLFGKTPLWLAARERRPDIVYFLLLHSAAPTCGKSWADCPLWLSGRYGGRNQIAAMLLACGCKILHTDSHGRNASDWARIRGDEALIQLISDAGLGAQASHQVSPPSLMWLTRQAIWGQVIRDSVLDMENFVAGLDIPLVMKDYLLLKDVVNKAVLTKKYPRSHFQQIFNS